MSTETKPELGNPEQKEKIKPKSFKTSQGSVYTYLPDGRTQRFKASTGEMSEPQDLIVFIPPYQKLRDTGKAMYPKIFGKEFAGDDDFNNYLAQLNHSHARKVRAVDAEGNRLENNQDAAAAGKAYLAFAHKTDPEQSFVLPVAKEPTVGYSTFDYRKFQKDGEWLVESHIGNPVTEITYED